MSDIDDAAPRASLACLPLELKRAIVVACADQDKRYRSRKEDSSAMFKAACLAAERPLTGHSLGSLRGVNQEFAGLADPLMFKTITASCAATPFFRFSLFPTKAHLIEHVDLNVVSTPEDLTNLIMLLGGFPRLNRLTLSRWSLVALGLAQIDRSGQAKINLKPTRRDEAFVLCNQAFWAAAKRVRRLNTTDLTTPGRELAKLLPRFPAVHHLTIGVFAVDGITTFDADLDAALGRLPLTTLAIWTLLKPLAMPDDWGTTWASITTLRNLEITTRTMSSRLWTFVEGFSHLVSLKLSVDKTAGDDERMDTPSSPLITLTTLSLECPPSDALKLIKSLRPTRQSPAPTLRSLSLTCRNATTRDINSIVSYLPNLSHLAFSPNLEMLDNVLSETLIKLSRRKNITIDRTTPLLDLFNLDNQYLANIEGPKELLLAGMVLSIEEVLMNGLRMLRGATVAEDVVGLTDLVRVLKPLHQKVLQWED